MVYEEFRDNLRKLLEGDKAIASSPLIVGRPSTILTECGAKAEQDITITKKIIDKAMRPEIRDENGRMTGNTGHGLTETQIIAALIELECPIMVFKGRQESSILVITNILDYKRRNIVVAIELGKIEGFNQVNSIRSLYGRDNILKYIGDGIESGNLLAARKQKADELLRSIGKSYPKENTFISYE